MRNFLLTFLTVMLFQSCSDDLTKWQDQDHTFDYMLQNWNSPIHQYYYVDFIRKYEGGEDGLSGIVNLNKGENGFLGESFLKLHGDTHTFRLHTMNSTDQLFVQLEGKELEESKKLLVNDTVYMTYYIDKAYLSSLFTEAIEKDYTFHADKLQATFELSSSFEKVAFTYDILSRSILKFSVSREKNTMISWQYNAMSKEEYQLQAEKARIALNDSKEKFL